MISRPSCIIASVMQELTRRPSSRVTRGSRVKVCSVPLIDNANSTASGPSRPARSASGSGVRVIARSSPGNRLSKPVERATVPDSLPRLGGAAVVPWCSSIPRCNAAEEDFEHRTEGTFRHGLRIDQPLHDKAVPDRDDRRGKARGIGGRRDASFPTERLDQLRGPLSHLLLASGQRRPEVGIANRLGPELYEQQERFRRPLAEKLRLRILAGLSQSLLKGPLLRPERLVGYP